MVQTQLASAKQKNDADILGGIGALLVALVTVSFQAIKAGRSNPATSLRSE